MIGLDVTVDDRGGIASWLSGARAQLPFALSVAINNTLNDAQAAIQSRLPAEFTLRRADFIERSIYIGPKDRAKKDNLVGTVRVNPARDYLAKFEEGGEKTSSTGKALAVPILRASDKTLIIRRGDPLSLQHVMQAIQERGGKLKRPRRAKGAPPPAGQLSSVYLVKSAKGTFVIQRTGSSTRVLYAFEREVPIPAALNFDAIALDAALTHWDQNVSEAIAYAMATAR